MTHTPPILKLTLKEHLKIFGWKLRVLISPKHWEYVPDIITHEDLPTGRLRKNVLARWRYIEKMLFKILYCTDNDTTLQVVRHNFVDQIKLTAEGVTVDLKYDWVWKIHITDLSHTLKGYRSSRWFTLATLKKIKQVEFANNIEPTFDDINKVLSDIVVDNSPL